MLKRIFAVLALAALASVTACKSAQKQDATDGMTSSTSIDDSTMGDSDSGKAMGLQTITFPYDSFTLTSEAKGILDSNAQILKTTASLKIQIEGHCDSRGGIQYNLALGEKRANAVKNALQGMGIAADRMTTISFGKERPVDPSESEAAHGKNRRANFVVTAK